MSSPERHLRTSMTRTTGKSATVSIPWEIILNIKTMGINICVKTGMSTTLKMGGGGGWCGQDVNERSLSMTHHGCT